MCGCRTSSKLELSENAPSTACIHLGNTFRIVDDPPGTTATVPEVHRAFLRQYHRLMALGSALDHQFPTGTRCRRSPNQFTTTDSFTVLSWFAGEAIARNRCPSGATSQPSLHAMKAVGRIERKANNARG